MSGNPDYDGDGWDWPDDPNDDWGLETDRCVSCGAEIDHYVGCPDDLAPDWEAEARVREAAQ